MGTLNNRKLFTTLVALALGVSAAACGDDSGEKGPGSPSINLDSGVPGLDSGPGSDATTGNGGNDGSVGADTGTPVVVNPGDCKGANGCYSCKPTPTITNAQLLNTCASGCREFNNSTRLPGFTGTLPPLQ